MLRVGKPCRCKATALLVEDNEFVTIPIRNYLRNKHKIISKRARNGLEGFNMFKEDLTKTCCDVHF